MWSSHAPSTLMAGAIHCSELASSPNLSVYKDACSTPTLDSPPLVQIHPLAGKYDPTAAGFVGSCSPTSSASTEILSREGSPALGLSQFRPWETGSPLSEAMAALETLRCQLDTRKRELDERQSSLTTLEAQLAWRRTGLDTQEAKLKLGEHELETRKSRLATQVGALDARTEELDAREKAIEAREANLKERRRETKAREDELHLRENALDTLDQELEAREGDLDRRQSELETRERSSLQASVLKAHTPSQLSQSHIPYRYTIRGSKSETQAQARTSGFAEPDSELFPITQMPTAEEIIGMAVPARVARGKRLSSGVEANRQYLSGRCEALELITEDLRVVLDRNLPLYHPHRPLLRHKDVKMSKFRLAYLAELHLDPCREELYRRTYE